MRGIKTLFCSICIINLKIKINKSGAMVPEIVKIESFKVKAKTIRTNNDTEFNVETAKIMPLWQECYQSGFCKEDEVSYGVYHKYASDYKGDYSVSVGVSSQKVGGEDLLVGGGKYLKFVFEGEMPQAVIDGWQYIWQYFSQSNVPERSYKTDFEKYIPGFSGVEIYISII